MQLRDIVHKNRQDGKGGIGDTSFSRLEPLRQVSADPPPKNGDRTPIIGGGAFGSPVFSRLSTGVLGASGAFFRRRTGKAGTG